MPHSGRVLVSCVMLAALALSPSRSLSEGSAPVPSWQVTIAEVAVRMSDHGPIVLLQAEGRVIPIFVDATVALSIQGALNGERLSRPMSHDLMHSILEAYGARVTQAVITLKDSTYYGTLTVVMNNETKLFDSRSSDSIALAVHFKAPILVGRDLLESAGKVPERSRGGDL